jgi:hypothetical protein
MAQRRVKKRTLSDALLRARAKGAKPPRVSLIQNGIKYKSGQAPVRVAPPGRTLARPSSLAQPLQRVVAATKAPVAERPQGAEPPHAEPSGASHGSVHWPSST